ncbi:hypothetical protein FQA39_LY12099 [Lamprigera yunnana]|nr:hypothetical protein FQA39_LY12099 [Lamprigera yunnana]
MNNDVFESFIAFDNVENVMVFKLLDNLQIDHQDICIIASFYSAQTAKYRRTTRIDLVIPKLIIKTDSENFSAFWLVIPTQNKSLPFRLFDENRKLYMTQSLTVVLAFGNPKAKQVFERLQRNLEIVKYWSYLVITIYK